MINEFLAFITDYVHCNVRSSNSTAEKRYIIQSPLVEKCSPPVHHVAVAMNMNYYHDLEDNKEAAQTFLW